jgi:putative component of toxin-antitoxin plasmid stabilization module
MWVYRCKLCGREFTDIVELLAHVEMEHAGDARVREVVSTWRSMRGAGYRVSRAERFRDLAEWGLAERRWVRGGAPL